MLSKEDEVKRSQIWRIVMSVSSVLVIVIAAFFLTKMFRSNPLEGTWRSEDSDLILQIKGKDTVKADLPEIADGEGIQLKLRYTIDKEDKTIQIEVDDTELQKAAKASDGQLTEEDLGNAVSAIVTTFDYSVDQERLTLTEREYGEQMIFVKE